MGAEQQSYVYGDKTAVIAQLEWEDESGEKHCLSTDDSFKWSNDGTIRQNDLICGETYDARMKPSYNGNARATEWTACLSASNNVPVTEHECFKPNIIHTPDGNTVLDFEQNINGYVTFNNTADEGRQVSMTMGEKLDENGNFTLSNILQEITFQQDTRDFGNFQRVTYICRDGKQTYKPVFSVQGFRYALLENFPDDIQPDDCMAIAVYSDMDMCMNFCCSSEDINRIVHNTLWSMKGNFLDVPTDCPTRKRAAWSGDGQIFFNAATCFCDTAAFFRK